MTYDGEWLNDMPHGHVIETMADTYTYEGNFVNGVRSGKGLMKWPSGA